MSKRTGHAFVPLSGTNGIGGRVSCRSAVTTMVAATGQYIRSVPVGPVSPSVAVDDPDGRVYVAAYTKSPTSDTASISITALDLQGRTVRVIPSLAICPCAGNALGPLKVGVDARHARLFVFTYQSVMVFKARTAQPLKTVALDSGTAGGGPNYAVDAPHGRVFVATHQGVTVLNSASGSIVQTINLSASERSLVLDARTGRLFVGSSGDCRSSAPGHVTVLDSATGKVLRSVLSSCFGFPTILVDEPAQQVLVRIPQATPNLRYAALDARSGRVLRHFNLPSDLTYTAVDARTGTIYNGAAICTEGQTGGCTRLVQVLAPRSWRIVKTLPIPSGWQGALTVAPQQRRLLVASPYDGTMTISSTN